MGPIDPSELSQVLRRLDAERRRLTTGEQLIEQLPLLSRLRSADGSHHTVIYSNLSSDTADEAIAGEIEHHRRLGVGFEWKWYAHDTPPDLAERLARHGLRAGPEETVLVRTAIGFREGAQAPDAAGIRVERVRTAELVRDFRSVAEEVFRKDYAFTTGELLRGLAGGSTQHLGYVAYAGHKPVSIGRLYTHPDSAFGGLSGGGTLAPYRGQGFYRATVAARAREAGALGARYLIVDALPTSRPILQRMGFERLTETRPYEWG